LTDVTHRIAFGVKVDSLLKKVEFAESFDAIQFYNFQRLVFPLHKYTEKLKNLNVFGSGKSITQHMNVVNEFAYKVIKGRHAQEADQNEDAGQQINYKTDLLLRFMKANNDKDELYTDKELRDFMLNFIVAGRDTSAQTLSWFFFSVMQTPRVEKKLLEEINEFITDGIEEDTVQLYEAIQKMKYSHAV
jgi:cytochrome P450